MHCNWQAHFFTRAPLLQSLVSDPEVADWLSQRSNRWNRGSDLSPVVLRAAADFILERESRRLGKRIVGDKSPNSLMDGEAVRLLHKVYPDGLLLFIVRDGRDTLLSHRIQQFIDAPQHLNQVDKQIRLAFSEDPEPFLKGETSLFTPSGAAPRRGGLGKKPARDERPGKGPLWRAVSRPALRRSAFTAGDGNGARMGFPWRGTLIRWMAGAGSSRNGA